MSNLTPPPTPTETPAKALPSPWRCFLGSLVAAGIAVAFYSLTQSIALAFAQRPIQSDNTITLNIAAAVRTLVVGMSALGAGVFGLAAVGLMGLGIQTLVQMFVKRETSP